MRRHLAALAALASLALVQTPAAAATGICDQSGATQQACLSAVQSLPNGSVLNQVFKDSSGKTADQLLPSQFGKLFQHYKGCTLANTICNGFYVDDNQRGCPQVTCVNGWSRSFDEVASYVNLLDWKYANPIRMHDGHGQDPTNPACPDWGNQVVDGNTDGYHPWEGMVFDLGGPSNKVSIFAVNDHGPQPCESTEYVVYLSDNPYAEETIEYPTTTGSDPQKWNRAVLSQIFLQGWTNVRDVNTQYRPDCGDVQGQYTVEADSFTTVYSLPCGLTFRYVAIAVGNDGKDGWNGDPNSPKPLGACQYDSFDGEIDAVAGLTEEGKAVCPDADGDTFVDCNCPTAPAVCDCNDADPQVHPGAPEKCDDPDKSCDGKPGSCAAGLTCFQSTCLPGCSDKGDPCPFGSVCQDTPSGVQLCVPSDCTVGSCPEGSVCDASSKTCVPACAGVVCPSGEKCVGGACVDPCAGIVCPSGRECSAGQCVPPCSCFAGDVGCQGGLVCDKGGTGACVEPSCKGVSCGAGKKCDPASGQCVDACQGVVCPKDNNDCTADVCKAGECVHDVFDDGTLCGSNGDMCKLASTCQAGACKAGGPVSCDDNNPCTLDDCDPTKGCIHENKPDGSTCKTDSACSPGACKAGACVGMAKTCDDGNPCTKDVCSGANGDCSHTPIPGCGSGGASGAAGASGGAGASGKAGASGASGASGSAGGSASGGASGSSGKGGSSGGSGSPAGGSSAGGKAGSAGSGGSGGKSGSAGAGAQGGSGGAPAGAGAASTDDSGEDGGCGCRAAGGDDRGGAALVLGLGLGALLARGNRRRRAVR